MNNADYLTLLLKILSFMLVISSKFLMAEGKEYSKNSLNQSRTLFEMLFFVKNHANSVFFCKIVPCLF